MINNSIIDRRNFFKFCFIIPIPFLFNFIFNFIKNDFMIPFISLNNMFFSFISFIFIYSFCSMISQSLDIESKSLSIGIFYISFFILNFTTLLFDKFFFNFNDYFNITIIFWIIYILRRFKHLSKLYLFLTGLSYLLIYFFKDLVIENKFIQSELSSDTSFFWTPMSKIIYENDLFFALENNIIPGYGLLINHIHAVNYKLFINESIYIFYPATSNIFLFFGILFIYELNVSKAIKFNALIIYVTILLNSDWLSYLFFNSTMGEGVTGFLFSVFFINLIKSKITPDNNFQSSTKLILIFFSGFIYFSKPFVSYLILMTIVLLFFKFRSFNILIFGFFGFLMNIFNFKFVLSNTNLDGYINSINIFNFEIYKNLNLNNINLILENFYSLDKVITLFFLVLYFLIFYNLIYLKYFSSSTLLFFVNVFLVFALYISFWKNVELGSAYRYIVSIFNLYFFIYSEELDKLQS